VIRPKAERIAARGAGEHIEDLPPGGLHG
jgi:hypothetical protein